MHVVSSRGQRIIGIRRDWLFRLLKAVDGQHFNESIPDDAEVTDFQYQPLSQTILVTISSQSYQKNPDGGMLSTTIIFGD
jgi:hypothetical protein